MINDPIDGTHNTSSGLVSQLRRRVSARRSRKKHGRAGDALTNASPQVSAGTADTSNSSRSNNGITNMNQRSRAVGIGRALFILFMICFGVFLAYGSFRVLRQIESDASEAEFISITERALVQAVASAHRDQDVTATMASTVAKLLPYADAWPFVYIPDFDVVSQNVLRFASPGSHIVFLPLVWPDQAEAFEEFAYDYYFHIRDPPHPNGTGDTVNGFGIWEEHVPENTHGDYDVSVDQTRIRNVTGKTNWGSPYRYLTPIFQWTSATFGLMFDTHSTETQGGYQTDSIINCTRARLQEQLQQTQNSSSNINSGDKHDPEGILACSALTEVFALWANQRGPESAIFSPIFPASNQTKLTGFIATLIIWKDVLQNLFSESVQGIDCVLQTSTQSFTYKVIDGEVHYYGPGDQHTDKERYNKYRRQVDFVDHGLFTENSPRYSFALYPNDEFYETYSTKNPWIAAFGSAAIFIVTCLLFFLYDYLVGKEVRAKQDLLKAKRHFMRFISHKVRTPLNSVCMGLQLVKIEIAQALGFSSSDAMREHLGGDVGGGDGDEKTQPVSSKPEEQKEEEEAGDEVEPNNDNIRQTVSCNDVVEWFQITSEVMEHAQSAVSVLSDILNYDKVEAGKLSLELAPLLVFPLIAKTVDEFRLSAENKGLGYKLIILAPNPHENHDEPSSKQRFRSVGEIPRGMQHQYVIGDWVRLQQVLRNFISNAIKFSNAGMVEIEASFVENDSTSVQEATKKGAQDFTLKNGKVIQLLPKGKIVVKIRDTGAGMTPEQLSRLFTAGTQFNVNELQAGQGSGLGLFITKGIVEQHGGSVVAKSEGLGKGTTFTLTLPAHIAIGNTGDEEEGITFTGSPNKTFDFDDGNMATEEDIAAPLRVLVVDDALANRRLLARLLEKHGDVCEQAEDGLECLDKVAAARKAGYQFDIILLDYQMPKLNGPQCAKKLRANGCSSLIVGITGNCLAEDVALFKSHGADEVLPKPFRMEALQEIWASHGIPKKG